MGKGLKDEELEIDSLISSQYWQEIKKTYYDNKNSFDFLARNFSKKYNVDFKTSRDAVIYEIMSCQYKNNKNLFNENIFKWVFLYLCSLFFAFTSGLVSFFVYSFSKGVDVDILYEEMWPEKSLYKRFYKSIDVRLGRNIKKSILFISPGIDFFNRKIQSWGGHVINKRYSGILFEFNISANIIRNDLFFIIKLYRLSKCSDINFVYIYLRLLRKLLMYVSQSCNIKSKVLISAGDYYWTPLKYNIYKRRISNIILLQHNNVCGYLPLRLFQYCDYYYAHSQESIDRHSLCGNAEFFNVGSFQLIPFLNKKDLEYDVIFLSQTVYDDLVANCKELDQNKLIKAYGMLVNNFRSYLEANPNVNAVYISKVGYENSSPTLDDKKTFNGLRNIKFISTSGKDTFEYISKSKIIINMYSSVGFESYGLDKRVLWINYDRCCDVFKLDTTNEDIHIMISDTTYTAFENKMALLLSENENVDHHYKGLKEKYMNIQKNPAELVAIKVKQLVMNEK